MIYSNRPLPVAFFRTESGKEPVREWLRGLTREEKKIVGEDIKKVQFGWPIGMPIVRKMESDLWEIRSDSGDKTIRILLTIHDNAIILLHGFIKKTQKTSVKDLELARKRLNQLKRAL